MKSYFLFVAFGLAIQEIQPFGPESAFFRDSPSGARGGVAQLPARRPRCMRRQGQRSPSVSVFLLC
ncbi:MAG TPA: hypothetical protein H9976_07215 [Candidatus Akkermansia intestinavium]|nr:hypothetical protein [Candidatus Akkermansia intestinavium]